MAKPDIWIFRNEFPGVHLPFYPRGGGINYFRAGSSEEHAPQDFCELCYVAKGKVFFDFGTVQAELSENNAILRLPFERRFKRVTGKDDAVIYYVTFDGKNAANFIKSFNYPRGAMGVAKSPVLLFETIFKSLSSCSEQEYRRLCALYMELFCLLNPQGESVYETPLTKECLHLIRLNCTDSSFNINLLADMLGIHRTTISRKVSSSTGFTAQQYLEKCRIEYAVELLRNTSLSIKETAEKAGFSRSNYFCRVIKNATGMTPGKLRKFLLES